MQYIIISIFTIVRAMTTRRVYLERIEVPTSRCRPRGILQRRVRDQNP